MAFTILDAHTSLAYRLGESAAPQTATELARRLDWFKKAIQIAAGGDENMWFMSRFTTDRTAANIQAYDFPTRLKAFKQIKVDDYKYEEIPFSEVYDKYELPQSPVPILSSFMARAFYQWNEDYHLIPIPGSAPSVISVSSLTSSGTTCTCTTTTNHGYDTGDYVEIAGANQTAYNGTFRVIVTSATTFTYTAASVPPATPATGTITAQEKNIKIWYWEYPELPTGSNSSIVVPDNYIDILVAFAEARYWSYAQRRAKSADAFQEFTELLNRLKIDNFRRTFKAG